MTKKDYIAIAAAIREQVDADANKGGHSITRAIADRIADACARDNARFDRGRFLAACGVQSD